MTYYFQELFKRLNTTLVSYSYTLFTPSVFMADKPRSGERSPLTHGGDSPPSMPTGRDPNEAIRETAAPLPSVLPSTSTPEPHQTASATELVAICSVWGALDTQGPLAATKRTHRGDSPPSMPTGRDQNEAIRDLSTGFDRPTDPAAQHLCDAERQINITPPTTFLF